MFTVSRHAKDSETSGLQAMMVLNEFCGITLEEAIDLKNELMKHPIEITPSITYRDDEKVINRFINKMNAVGFTVKRK